MKHVNGVVVYDGPSMLNGQRILGIVTGLRRSSKNPKTGQMHQLWILSSKRPPQEAAKRGDNAAVCGSCPLIKACYVSLFQGPRAVYDAFQRGNYPPIATMAELSHRSLRFGAYGDPAALPLALVQRMAKHVPSFTGYTHQWRTASWRFRRLLMASVESLEDAKLAWKKGWRTFRVVRHLDELAENEIVCPASAEMGHRTTCEQCRLCNGSTGNGDRRKNIAIVAHGKGKKAFAQMYTENR